MYKIYYDVKNTTATTQYVSIVDKDITIILESIMSVNNWIQELSISQDKDIRGFTKWYSQPAKKYPYNSKLKKTNSPQSIIAGILNNLMWGDQRDFSLIQLDMIIELNNIMIDIVETIINEKSIVLQTKPKYTKIWAQENIW